MLKVHEGVRVEYGVRCVMWRVMVAAGAVRDTVSARLDAVCVEAIVIDRASMCVIDVLLRWGAP